MAKPPDFYSLEQLGMLNEQAEDFPAARVQESDDPSDTLGYSQKHLQDLNSPLARAGWNPYAHVYTEPDRSWVMGRVRASDRTPWDVNRAEKDPQDQNVKENMVKYIDKNYKDKESNRWMMDNAVQFNELIRTPASEFENKDAYNLIQNAKTVPHESLHRSFRMLERTGRKQPAKVMDAEAEHDEHLLVYLWQYRHGTNGNKEQAQVRAGKRGYADMTEVEEKYGAKLDRLEKAAVNMFPQAANEPMGMLKLVKDNFFKAGKKARF